MIGRFRADPVIARCFPFALFIALLILSSGVGSLLPAGEQNAIGYWIAAGRGVVLAIVIAWLWPAYTELHSPPPTSSARWMEAIVAGLLVFVLWINLDQDWAILSKSVQFSPQSQAGDINWTAAALRLFGLALVVPLMEELFWRSFILRWIEQHDFLAVDPRRVGARAMLITTVLFALEHQQWLAGAIAGATYNLLYKRSGNLWVPIVSHAVTNAALGVWILHTKNWQFW